MIFVSLLRKSFALLIWIIDHLFLSQTIRTNDIDITYSPAKHFTTWKKICLKYLQEKASNNDLDHLILHNICYMEE